MKVRALFVDAAGTLLKTREPVGLTYARVAREHGHPVDPFEVEQRFRAAMRRPRGQPQGLDGRSYWRPIVSEALGVDDEATFDALYDWYAEPRAWWVDTEALRWLGQLARSGVRLGILSNWDGRLRVLYNRFALDRMFPFLVCSAELELEKPDPAFFRVACLIAGVSPDEAVHVGDDPVNDVQGASDAGLVGLRFDDDQGWRAVYDQVDRLRRSPFMLGR